MREQINKTNLDDDALRLNSLILDPSLKLSKISSVGFHTVSIASKIK